MLKKLFLKIVICVFLITSQSLAFPQFLDLSEIGDEIFLVVGGIQVLEVYFPKRVSVRNPEIADIDSVSDKEIILVAKQAGSTSLTIWDREGERTYYITVYAQDPDALSKRLSRAINKRLGIGEVYFKKNDATGKVMVIGEVTAAEKEQIEKILLPFVESIDNLLVVGEASQMVEVDCHILELTKSFSEVFGLDWTGTSGTSPAALTQVTNSAVNTAGKFQDILGSLILPELPLMCSLWLRLMRERGKFLLSLNFCVYPERRLASW